MWMTRTTLVVQYLNMTLTFTIRTSTRISSLQLLFVISILLKANALLRLRDGGRSWERKSERYRQAGPIEPSPHARKFGVCLSKPLYLELRSATVSRPMCPWREWRGLTWSVKRHRVGCAWDPIARQAWRADDLDWKNTGEHELNNAHAVVHWTSPAPNHSFQQRTDDRQLAGRRREGSLEVDCVCALSTVPAYLPAARNKRVQWNCAHEYQVVCYQSKWSNWHGYLVQKKASNS